MPVLPTPAPPKMPTLPPFLNGQMRSMILRPVSNTSTSVDCSSNGGASRWMGNVVPAPTGPLLSIGRPRTSNTRPSVASPTGTEIGAPVSHGDAPRQAVGRGHRHRPDPVVAEVLLDLADERVLTLALDLDGVQDRRQLAGRELDVD